MNEDIKTGLGCGGDGPLSAGVYAMLAAGSPRLALAKAWGVPLAPYLINVRAPFPDTATPVALDIGSDAKIYQDTLIDSLVIRVQNKSETANQNSFQPQSDFYFGIQSGIEATLSVQGTPRYEVASKFTPISTLADMICSSHWPGGWILTYQQQLFMSFEATVALPTAPIEVICTFRGWIPTTDDFEGESMSQERACAILAELGYNVAQGYKQRSPRR